MYHLGLDVGGTSVKMGLVDDDFNIIHRDAYSVSFDNYKTPIFESVQKGLEDFIGKYHVDMSQVGVIGISSTGQIDSNLGKVVGSAGHVGEYSNVDLRGVLHAKWGKPVYALNDANAAALGELTCGAMKGYSHGIMLVVGTGIGAGVVIDGKVLNGRNGFAGEIGHTSISADGEKCTCGNVGCYERLASTIALVKQVESNPILRGQFKDENGEFTEINGKTIFDLYEAGNEVIAPVVDKWISYVAIGIANVTNIFNPEIVVIGGAVSQRKVFMDLVKVRALEYALPRLAENVEFVEAQQANDAGIIGAVKFGTESLKKSQA